MQNIGYDYTRKHRKNDEDVIFDPYKKFINTKERKIKVIPNIENGSYYKGMFLSFEMKNTLTWDFILNINGIDHIYHHSNCMIPPPTNFSIISFYDGIIKNICPIIILSKIWYIYIANFLQDVSFSYKVKHHYYLFR